MNVIKRLPSIFLSDKNIQIPGNVVFDNTLKIDVTCQLTQFNSYPRIVGHVGTYSSVFNSAFMAANNNNVVVYPGATQLTITDKYHKNLFSYDFSNGTMTVTDLETSDQYTVAGTFNSYSATTTLNLLGGGDQAAKFRGYFFSAQVRESGVLTHDIYPALVDDNGTYKIGLYDAITDSLIYTDSTGTNLVWGKITGTVLQYSDQDEDGLFTPYLGNMGVNEVGSTITEIEPYKTGLSILRSSFADMFSGLTNLTRLDLSGFITPTTGTVSLNNMCYNCSALTDITYPQMAGATVSGAAFNRAGTEGITLKITGDFTALSDLSYLFASINGNSIATSSGRYGCYYSHIDITDCEFDVGGACDHILAGWQNLTEIVFPELSNVTSLSYALVDCHKLITADMHQITTTTGTFYTFGLFFGCYLMNYWMLPKAKWDHLYVFSGNSYGTFGDAGGPGIVLKVSGSLADVTNLAGLFTGENGSARNQKNMYGEIDLSAVSFGTVTGLRYTFAGCPNLRTIYAKQNIYQGTGDTTGTFQNCSASLKGQAGTVWNSSAVTGDYAVLDGETPGYLTYRAQTDYTNVIFQPEGSGTAIVVSTGDEDEITINLAENYVMIGAMLYDQSGRFIAKYTTTTITVRRTDPGVWTLYVNCVKSGVSPYPGDEPLPDQGYDGGTIESDTIDKSVSLPYTGSLITVFIPSDAELKELCDILFAGTGDLWDAITSFTAGVVRVNFTDFILTCHVLPVSLTKTGDVSNIKFGWFPVVLSQGIGLVSLPYINYTHTVVDCGSLTLPRYWNNALDYQSRVEIYLPFIGYKALDCVDVMDRTLHVVYDIDILSGDCVASIYVDDSIHYQFTGNCAYNLPVSANNYSDMIQQGLLSAAMIDAGVSTMNAGTALKNSKHGDVKLGAQMEATGMKEAGDAASGYLNLGSGVQRSGSIGSNAGYLSSMTPHLMIVRPNVSMPANYGHYNGFPSNKTMKLSSLHGYTEVDDIHLENIPCTADEQKEIFRLLKEGVII